MTAAPHKPRVPRQPRQPPANPLGEATFTADGTTYTLAATNRAFINAEAETGWPFPVLLQELAIGNLHALTTMLWSALQKHHATPLDGVDDLVMAHGEAAFAALAKAAEWALPKAKEGAAENPPPATTGTGSNASPDGAPKG